MNLIMNIFSQHLVSVKKALKFFPMQIPYRLCCRDFRGDITILLLLGKVLHLSNTLTGLLGVSIKGNHR